jgi:hypothetical protein
MSHYIAISFADQLGAPPGAFCAEEATWGGPGPKYRTDRRGAPASPQGAARVISAELHPSVFENSEK